MQTAVKARVRSNGKVRTRYFRTFTRHHSDSLGGWYYWTGEEVTVEGDKVDRVWVVDDTQVVSQAPVTMNRKYTRFE
jgi:hypothetical protein